MTERNYRMRFCDNNFAELTSAQIVYSSQLAAFPFSNAINPFRSKVWKPSGNFDITTDNQNIYINDGSDKTVAITVGAYSTPLLLAAQVETDLNSASSNWTVTYDSSGGTYRFTMAHTGSATLRLSQTTSSMWNTLGYTTSTDIIGTSFVADQQRTHTSEYCIFDLGYSAPITFFAMIGPLGDTFSISNNAVVKLMANNLNEWSDPPFSITLDISDLGIMRFLDDYDDTGFRYWKIEIFDFLNVDGPNAIGIGHIFLGNYLTLAERNVQNGFEQSITDPSIISESENGTLYFDTKIKYNVFSAMGIGILSKADRESLKTLFKRKGLSIPFYISIDPTNIISDEVSDFTKYVVFNDTPSITHLIYDKFDMQMSFREVL